MSRLRSVINGQLFSNLKPLLLYIPLLAVGVWFTIIGTPWFASFILVILLLTYFSFLKPYLVLYRTLKKIKDMSKRNYEKTLELIQKEIEDYKGIVNAPTDELDYHSLNARDEMSSARASRNYASSNAQTLAFFLRLEEIAINNKPVFKETDIWNM